MFSSTAVNSVAHSLDSAEKVLVTTHIAPDGDAISSLTATGVALRQLGRSFTLVCNDDLPERFNFLPLSNLIRKVPVGSVNYDLIIALDAGSIDRLGKTLRELPEPLPLIINIDHHPTNTNYGHINIVVPEASATAEILFHLLPQVGIRLNSDIATCLLTGIVTDTLSFSTAAVTAGTLSASSSLVEAGADIFSVTSKALRLKPLSHLLMWQSGLKNLKMEDGLIWTTVSNEERQITGHAGSDSLGLSNMLADVYEATMSAVLLEMGNDRVSVSFRCRPPYNVSTLAEDLGGGGHHLAAGCTLEGSLQQVESLVIARAKESIRQQRAIIIEQRHP